ncbi:hypothetical protein [Rhizomicrobium electricum]|uniref:Uncharacterized protein n=1 Tax=Rhizomicrobium electricum TaxID=480070 RepID=A0ABN1EPB5_9PROT|nr:hypothetical protein [Rhizomicrobium electricum]NIJ48801.1 hypothetical protein [Rhizomicrobium electricum]
MTTRRDCLAGLTGFTALAGVANARNTLAEVLKVGPKPKLIKGGNGVPDKVDFGHGLLVPMSNDAFHALWEGDDRWIAYGHGFGHNRASAMGQAERAAVGTMKLYLLTLAFTPERLERIEGGGWRLKSGKIADLVQGDIELPGRPVMPTTDAVMGMIGGSHANTGSAAGIAEAGSSPAGSPASGEETVHATTGWLIWKREVSLDDVRRKAVLAGN